MGVDNPVRASHSRDAFTLVELLISLALLLIISTMYFGFSSPNRQRSAKQSCRVNLGKLSLALEIYAADHAGKFPTTTNLSSSEAALAVLVPRYTVDTEIFVCPGARNPPEPSTEPNRRISYAYYLGRQAGGAISALMSDAQVNTNSKSAGDPIFSADGKPPGNNHHQFGGNIAFTDGRVEFCPTNLPFPLLLIRDVVLLNPKP